MTFDIRGLSYEQASRRGEELILRAAKTGNWHAILDELCALRLHMNRKLREVVAA